MLLIKPEKGRKNNDRGKIKLLSSIEIKKTPQQKDRPNNQTGTVKL